jgi:hypothetical protein
MDFDTTPYDNLVEKWEPVLDHDALPSINDYHRKRCTAVLLENQEKAIREQMLTEYGNEMGGAFLNPQVGTVGNNALAGYSPVLISLVRRAMPNLIAYDITGVQPMTAPTGLIFAMRSRYGTQSQFTSGQSVTDGVLSNRQKNEALFQSPFPVFSGKGYSYGDVTTGGVSGAAAYDRQNPNPFDLRGLTNGSGASYNQYGIADATMVAAGGSRFSWEAFRGMLTSQAENLGDPTASNGRAFQEMSFSIERLAVEARSRALKAEYTTELAQDLKAVHGLDAETELANILSQEILHEINREVLYTVYRVAKKGCNQSDLYNHAAGAASGGGVYDLVYDSDGRWSAERFRGLMFQIEREANTIAKETRRGKGNFILCSSDVASALAMGGYLNISPALNVNLEVDDTGNVFAGVLNNKFRVYIDPYAPSGTNFVVVGYKGQVAYDAGLFYCPYVPLQMFRAVGQDTFQPKIGFKTRYGMVSNPFAEEVSLGEVGTRTTGNQYYRLFRVDNLHGIGATGLASA